MQLVPLLTQGFVRLWIILVLLFGVTCVRGQGFNTFSGRNHPEIEWRVAETPHFKIMYPAHLAGIEVEAAAVAEASYEALSANLQTTFDRKIRIYLSDEDENVNGFAVPLGEGYTNIWIHTNATAETFTGNQKWVRRVVPHELAHIFHYRATRSNLGTLGRFFSDPTPRFWTEGLAQYQTEAWDAERGERWLRTATLEGRLGYNDGTSIWNGRLLYSSGNAQVRFFAQQYGDTTLAKLLAHRRPVLLGLGRVHDLGAAFQKVTGEPYSRFYERWRRHVTVQYGTLASRLETVDSLDGRFVLPGQYLYDVQPGPDTSRTAFVRLVSLERPVRQLVVTGDDPRVLAEGSVQTPITWDPRGALIAFSQTVRGEGGAFVNDLFLAGSRGEGVRRLTRNRRASHPTFSPNGQRLAFAGSERGTANVFMIDLSTWEERETPLTAFTGDVQITGLAWHPTQDRIALAWFDEGGTRRIDLLDATTGEITPLTDGVHDDRRPVWSPDGQALAYTSLRDGVPNVFRLDLATNTHERVTNVATGATATAWLPADSAHAEGRLIVLSHVSKTRDRAFFVDAGRSMIPDSSVVPPEYEAWQTHQPPNVIPDAVAEDESLILSRSKYNPLANLTHGLTLPFPYFGRSGRFGFGAFSVWVEPLSKHLIAGAVGVTPERPSDSFVSLQYINNTLRPTIGVSLYRLPGTARVYGTDVLVETLTGGDVTMTLPIDRFYRPYAATQFEAKVTFAHSDPLEAERFAELTDGLSTPREGTQASIEATLVHKRQRPFRDNLIHPLDGLGARLSVRGAPGVFGTDTRYVRGDAAAYIIAPALGLHRVMFYGRGQAQTGSTLPQDYLGFSRYDDPQIALPTFLPFSLNTSERVRGYRSYVVGDALLFGSMEYRIPLVGDLQTRLLGFLSFGAASLALFTDAGVVWRKDGETVQQTGVGAEVKNVLRIGSALQIGHALGVAQPTSQLGEEQVDVYYRIRLAVPF